MKKLYILIFVILSFCIFSPARAAETVDAFDTLIKINSDATINVTETIKYNFGEEERHGIYRFIPIKYEGRGGYYNLRISDISVTDEKNQPLTTEITYPENNVNIKIGDADILLSGLKTYVINYKIRRAVNYFTDHDELYWNVTGNEWQVPISNVSAQIIFPGDLKESDIKQECFSGSYGSTEKCTSAKISLNNLNEVENLTFTQKVLNPYEGLTIVTGWPVGLVTKPTWQQILLDIVSDNIALILPLFVILVCYLYWYFKGRDPQGRGTIIAEYEAPDNLSPAEVGTILDEKTDKKDISSEIISLAVQGYLKIKREVPDTFMKKPNYTLIKLKPSTDLKVNHEKKLLESLFETTKTEVALDSLSGDFFSKYQEITKDIYDLTVTNGYFPKNPSKMRNTFLVVGLIAVFVVFLFANTLDTTFGLISCAISSLIIIIFSRFMSKRTLKGVLTKEKILGLKEYLTVAEKDRLKFHNAPEKNPELFEKLLPFAMTLAVENQWASQFAEIYKQPPKWYDTDEDKSTFNSLILANSLSNFSSQAGASLSTPPASASSGSSGFSGGGSGGGFGGGGGGSW